MQRQIVCDHYMQTSFLFLFFFGWWGAVFVSFAFAKQPNLFPSDFHKNTDGVAVMLCDD